MESCGALTEFASAGDFNLPAARKLWTTGRLKGSFYSTRGQDVCIARQASPFTYSVDSAMYCFTALSSVKGFLASSAEGMLMQSKPSTI